MHTHAFRTCNVTAVFIHAIHKALAAFVFLWQSLDTPLCKQKHQEKTQLLLLSLFLADKITAKERKKKDLQKKKVKKVVKT